MEKNVSNLNSLEKKADMEYMYTSELTPRLVHLLSGIIVISVTVESFNRDSRIIM